MSLHGGITVSYDLEPFTKYGEYATESAFPHTESPLPVSYLPTFHCCDTPELICPVPALHLLCLVPSRERRLLVRPHEADC